MDEAVAMISRWLEEGLPAGGAARLVVTANPEIVYNARRDRELARVLAQAPLVVADGIGIGWAARRYGRPVPERVPGVDLMMALLERAARRGWRPFFFGHPAPSGGPGGPAGGTAFSRLGHSRVPPWILPRQG